MTCSKDNQEVEPKYNRRGVGTDRPLSTFKNTQGHNIQQRLTTGNRETKSSLNLLDSIGPNQIEQ